MKGLFGVQLLATLGEIAMSSDQTTKMEALYLKLWPGMNTVTEGWLFINVEFYTTVGLYVISTLLYLCLFLMVRSKRMGDTVS